jgi:predicted nucleotidyltransferase
VSRKRLRKVIDIENLKREVVNRLAPLNLEKIILFGSYAYGKPHEDSDIDLYIVTKDNFIPASWKEKNQIYLKVARILQDVLQAHPTDLIIHTKKMHEKFISLNSSFSRTILKQGISLL